MALPRFTKAVDGTIPIPALLYDDEELLASQDGVGIYDGPQKSANHQSGTVYATTHRLFYIDGLRARANSFALDLGHITQTEYYAGLFTSSAKVTLHLDPSSPPSPAASTENVFESWVCEVCGNRNPSGLSPSAARVCALCGVPRSAVPAPIPIATNQQSRSLSVNPPPLLSSSLPQSTPDLPHLMPPTNELPCPACTFLNHPSLHACEICATPLPRVRPHTKSAPASRPASPELGVNDTIMRISFRRGGDKAFYLVLKRTLKAKAWEAKGIGRTATLGAPSEMQTSGRSGISGILRTVENSAQSTETDMKDALKDLEGLMVKAKDMVRLAAELNERLTASSTTTTTTTYSSGPSTPSGASSTATLVPSTEPEEATFIRSSLSQLGLQMRDAPVTLDMIRDERRWIEELARELAGVLQGGNAASSKSGKEVGMMKDRGIIALDEVWGGWNRARGVALIPPSTFLQVLPQLPVYTDPPIRNRVFPSGLSVLHTPPYTHVAFSARLAGLLALSGPKTTIEIAQEEELLMGLVEEMVHAVEIDGDVCRDDAESAIGGGGGVKEVKWWPNVFHGYVWDGHD